MLDKSNSTVNGTHSAQLGFSNRTGGNVTNHTFTLPSENYGFAFGNIVREAVRRTYNWFFNWFAPSPHQRHVQNIKTKRTIDRTEKMFNQLEEKIRDYQSAPNDASKLVALQHLVREYFDASQPYEEQISSLVMAEVHGVLNREGFTKEQITTVTELPILEADVVDTPPPTPAPSVPPSRLVQIPDVPPHLQILYGREFLHLFTGGSLELKAANTQVVVELGKLFAQYQAQDTSEGFDFELSPDTNLFIGRSLAQNSQNLGQRSRNYYGLTKTVYNDDDHYQISIKFLQMLLNSPLSRKNYVCAATSAKTLQYIHNQLMRAQPGKSVGTYEVVDAPAGSGDIETLAEIISPRSFMRGFIPITTIAIHEGPTYTADELAYLRGYNADVLNQAPASVHGLVAEHSYMDAVKACPEEDLPELTKHFDQLLLSFTRRDETLYRQPERLSDAELINRQRRGVFDAPAASANLNDDEEYEMLRARQ